jgi:hypothetical protein
VTIEENYSAMRAKGDYTKAGIVPVEWDHIPADRRTVLWTTMLRGKVANADRFRERHMLGFETEVRRRIPMMGRGIDGKA